MLGLFAAAAGLIAQISKTKTVRARENKFNFFILIDLLFL
jgi:hypothetical protein